MALPKISIGSMYGKQSKDSKTPFESKYPFLCHTRIILYTEKRHWELLDWYLHHNINVGFKIQGFKKCRVWLVSIFLFFITFSFTIPFPFAPKKYKLFSMQIYSMGRIKNKNLILIPRIGGEKPIISRAFRIWRNDKTWVHNI